MLEYRRSQEQSLESLLFSHTRAQDASSSRTPSLAALEFREIRLRAEAAESELASSRIEILERLAITADLKEESSGEHGVRVGRLSRLFAETLDLSREECDAVELGARLHDIGKVAIPDKILLTSEDLKAAERGLMCAHAAFGAEILTKSTIPQLRVAEDIARYHHEWWNGNGYPARLSGRRIPLSARIVALADVFDAMTHGRPYASPWPTDRALQELSSLSGDQFDPELTPRFVAMIGELVQAHISLDAFLTASSRNSPYMQARAKIRAIIDRYAETASAST
jgi:putative two-component system response regulator